MDKINDLLLYLPVLLLAFTFHEFGHAWVAWRLGDDTAYKEGRVTLDPRSHIDPIGSILFPALAAMTGAPILGWARPVPFNPSKMRNPRRGDLLVSLAGVAMNLVLVLVFTIFVAILVGAGAANADDIVAILMRTGTTGGGVGQAALQFGVMGILVNVSLIVFNLLPIPPLDGSKVVYHFLPRSMAEAYRGLDRYGFLILWALVLTRALSFMSPVVYGITVFFLQVALRAA
ncbi:MAG TPA: site-2 protease family protein [Longimicrobium sp.]|nr:site-2 protease family protein [Longimicrobium sp.]